MLDEDETEILVELFREYPTQPAKIIEQLGQRTGKTIARDTLREYAHRLGLRPKRARKSLRKKRDDKAFERCRSELEELLRMPDLDVMYFDEAGVSLRGVVPYGWYRAGARGEVPMTGGQRSSAQVLGFEEPDGHVESYIHQGYVNSDVVIEVFDDYVQRIDGTTVVVIDNASCHTSKTFLVAAERWEKQGRLVYNLSPYGPELNSIERLWRKVKYNLMPPTAWTKFKTLVADLTAALKRCGEVTYLASIASYAEWNHRTRLVKGGKRVDRSGIDSRFAKGGLNRFVVDPGHFNRSDAVGNIIFSNGIFDRLDHCLGAPSITLDIGRFNEDFAIEFAKHELRALPGAIDADNNESFGPSGLDAALDDASRLADNAGLGVALCGLIQFSGSWGHSGVFR